MPVTVTFDTNTLASVVSPENGQRGTETSGATVQAAIQAGHIRGFFSETIVTVEGIKSRERWEVLGQTRTISTSSSEGNKITISVGIRHVRKPLDNRFSARIQGALALGMRVLRAPARMGDFHLKHKDYPFLEPLGGVLVLVHCMDGVNEMATNIGKRGLGQAVAVELGVQFSKAAGVSEPELWLEGLGRAQSKREREKVTKVCREWADGDSVASHYGFGIDLFCSDDFAKGVSGPSVLDRENRKWLSNEFDIQFVTLAELAQRVLA
jgi:hypothetical protein